VQQALEWYPFKRAKLYEFLSRGDIRSFVLKKRGALRGCRLIDRESLDFFLESKARETGLEVTPSEFGQGQSTEQEGKSIA
jgi:hypothetical protein